MSSLVFPLRHGLLLTIDGEPALRSVRNFLAAAAVHFKNQRDIQKTELYTAGSFQGRLGDADGVISNPADGDGRYLPPALWADAVLEAYRRVSALENLRTGAPDAMEANPAIADLLQDDATSSHLAALALLMLGSLDDDGDAADGGSDTVH